MAPTFDSAASKLSKIHARQILDSRGNPTLEVEVHDNQGHKAFAAVPSGASTGSREALELRDGNKSIYLGKGVQNAIKNVHQVLAPKLIGMGTIKQREIDQLMLDLDGTEYKSKLGANALLGVSLAVARLGALASGKSLYSYLAHDLHAPHPGAAKAGTVLPTPLMNIINGGAHASNNLDIQEFMIVPRLKKVLERI